jgi:DNA-binding HxlR family transcriptional regulator
MAGRSYGQYCGVASALDLVGERWALLIVRDLLVGPRRYSDLQAGLPRIPTNILSARLKELQAGGVVRRAPVVRGGYELTAYGRELEDVVLALGRWGFKSMGEPQDGDVVTSDSLTMAFRTAFVPDAARRHPDATYVVHVGDVSLVVRVERGRLAVVPLNGAVPAALAAVRDDALAHVDLEFAAGPGIRDVTSGELSGAEAIARDVVHIVHGDPDMLDRFGQTFHLEPAVPTSSDK